MAIPKPRKAASFGVLKNVNHTREKVRPLVLDQDLIFGLKSHVVGGYSHWNMERNAKSNS